MKKAKPPRSPWKRGGRGTRDGVNVKIKKRKPRQSPVTEGSHQGGGRNSFLWPWLFVMFRVFRSAALKTRAEVGAPDASYNRWNDR